MLIEFAHEVIVTIGLINENRHMSKREYKEKEALRRSQLTETERRREDISNFLLRTDS
jgi:hypothetical protein